MRRKKINELHLIYIKYKFWWVLPHLLPRKIQGTKGEKTGQSLGAQENPTAHQAIVGILRPRKTKPR